MPEPDRSLLLRLRSFSWIFLFFLLALSVWFSAGWLGLCVGLAAYSASWQGCASGKLECPLDDQQTSSLMNDLGYVSRITQSLRNVLPLGQGEGNELFRPLRQRVAEDGPLIQLDCGISGQRCQACSALATAVVA